MERWREEFGPGGVIEEAGPVYPCLPVYCLTEGSLEEALPVGEYVDLPVPVDPRDVPHSLQRITDTMGDNYVVRWPRKVKFTNGELASSRWISCRKYGAEEAKELAWAYFSARYRGMLPDRDPFDMSEQALRGPLGEPDEFGRRFHGDRDHRFTVWSFGKPLVGTFKVASWNPWSDTCDLPEEFCGHCRPNGQDATGNQIFERLGHEPELGGITAAGAHGSVPFDIGAATLNRDDVLEQTNYPTLLGNISDSWDMVLREKRYVRIHEKPRAMLFDPGNEGLDEHGAPSVRLDGARLSVLFFENGDVEVYVDDWKLGKHDYDAQGRGVWTGRKACKLVHMLLILCS